MARLDAIDDHAEDYRRERADAVRRVTWPVPPWQDDGVLDAEDLDADGEPTGDCDGMKANKRCVKNPCEQCEEHGAAVEIYTAAEQTIPGGACAFDGDECRCAQGCRGWMTADGDAFCCNWHEGVNASAHGRGTASTGDNDAHNPKR